MEENKNIENEFTSEVPLVKNRPYNKIFKILFWILIVFIASVCGIAILIYFYQDEIKKLAIDEVNKNLQTEVIINPKDIEVTFIKTFPDACIQFKNASILEPGKKGKKETIIKINELRLHFNISDILDGRYNINELSLYDSQFNFKRFEDGKNNFSFIKNDSLKNNNDKMTFEIKVITLKNIQFVYEDKKTKIKLVSELEKFKLAVQSKEENFDTEGKGEIFIREFIFDSRKIIEEQNVQLSGRYVQKNNGWEINNTALIFNKINLEMNGGIQSKNEVLIGDINFQIKQLEYATILPYLGDTIKNQLKDFEIDGEINVDGNISGKFSDYENLKIKSNFNTMDLNLVYLPKKIELDGLSFIGSFNKNVKKNEVLKIKNIQTQVLESKIEADLIVTNFSEPIYKLNSKVKGRIEDVLKILRQDSTLKGTGNINAEIEISGVLKNLDLQYFLAENKSSIELSSVKLIPHKISKEIEIKTGKLNIVQNNLSLDGLQIETGSSSFVLNGKTPSLTRWLLDSSKTKIFEGSIKADNLEWKDLSDLFPPTNNASKKDKIKKSKFPENISFKLGLSIASGVAENINLKNLSGSLELNNGKLLFENIKFYHSKGEFKLNCLLSEDDNKLQVKGYADIDKMNITESFKNFNNFGQSTLTEKNIRGTASAKIDFIGEMDENLNLIDKKIKSTCDLTIENGQLIEFAPLDGLAKFIDIKELRNVKFSTLKTRLEIHDEKITIDKTTLENNALNINFSGTHGFNQEIDYKVSLHLSELMAKRPGKKKELDEELSNVESDPENRRKVFIKIYGKMNDLKYKYDRAAAKEKIKEDLKIEKQHLKEILRDEFGWFKKDSTLTKKKRKEIKTSEELKFRFGNDNKNKEEKEEDEDF